MSQTSFRWPLTLTHTLAHLHEEDQNPYDVFAVVSQPVVQASILHTIFHQFSNVLLNLVCF
jgi:hypothetical protein